jgi:hypothetical protein
MFTINIQGHHFLDALVLYVGLEVKSLDAFKNSGVLTLPSVSTNVFLPFCDGVLALLSFS